MTEPTGTYSAQPGWYADPSGLPQHRWWDGTRWTDELYNPSAQNFGAKTTPVVGPHTPVYNFFIWALAISPVLSFTSLALFNFSTYATQIASRKPIFFDPSYLFLTLFGWVSYAVIVVLAFFDWRKLGRDGFEKPFHWAFAFLGGLVYLIGRSVVVRRVTRRGLAPIWVYVGLTLVTIVWVAIKLIEFTWALVALMPHSYK